MPSVFHRNLLVREKRSEGKLVVRKIANNKDQLKKTILIAANFFSVFLWKQLKTHI